MHLKASGMAFLLLSIGPAYGQLSTDVPVADITPIMPFSGFISALPSEYSAQGVVSQPIFSDGSPSPGLRVGVGLLGRLQLFYSNDAVAANPIAGLSAHDSWGLKLKVFGDESSRSSVLVWASGSFEWTTESLSATAIYDKTPTLNAMGLNEMKYDYRSMIAGLAAQSQLGDRVIVFLSTGVQELQSQAARVYTYTEPGQPPDYHPVEPTRDLLLDLHVGFFVQLVNDVGVYADAGTVPYFNLNLPVPAVEVKGAYNGTIGLQYSLPIPVQLSLDYRWMSSINNVSDGQVRLGLSSLLNIAS